MRKSNIAHSRPNVRVNRFLEALAELKFIEKIAPSINEMKKMKSSTVEKLTLHITLPDNNTEIEKVIMRVQK